MTTQTQQACAQNLWGQSKTGVMKCLAERGWTQGQCRKLFAALGLQAAPTSFGNCARGRGGNVNLITDAQNEELLAILASASPAPKAAFVPANRISPANLSPSHNLNGKPPAPPLGKVASLVEQVGELGEAENSEFFRLVIEKSCVGKGALVQLKSLLKPVKGKKGK